MKTNNISNQNFTGTFIFTPKTKETREAIPNIIKKGRQIFHNIRTEGDVVIVTRDNYDKKVHEFITKAGLKFSYCPKISTKSGLDDEQPEKLKELLKIHANSIRENCTALTEYIPAKKLNFEEQSNYLKETLTTLRLNVDDAIVTQDKRGIYSIVDKAHKRTIKSSGFKNGIAYIYIQPDSYSQSSYRFLVGQNGKEILKQYETPEETKLFNKKFISALDIKE